MALLLCDRATATSGRSASGSVAGVDASIRSPDVRSETGANTLSGIRYVARDLGFPEGPIAMSDGTFLVVDIYGGRLLRSSATGVVSVIATTGGGPNGAAIGPDGACYVCNNGGFEWTSGKDGLSPMGQARDYAGGRIDRIDLRSGQVRRLYDRSENGPLKGPNDLVFDRTGGFWFTDTGKSRARDMDRGGLYYALADGSSIREVAFPMLQPNGVGLSPQEDVLYVVESYTARLWAFDLDGPGNIKRHAWPSPNGGRLIARVPGYRLCDSLKVDAEGNIVVATVIEGGIITFSPKGDVLEDVKLPDRFVTNICFGGKDLQTAYVTMSQSGRLAEMPWRRPGLKLNFSDAFAG